MSMVEIVNETNKIFNQSKQKDKTQIETIQKEKLDLNLTLSIQNGFTN